MAKSSIERLRFCNFKLRTLLNITQAINQNLPTEELLATFEQIISQELNIGRFLLYSNLEKKWEPILFYGVKKEDYEKIDIKKDLLPLTSIEITIGEGNDVFSVFDFVIPIFKNNEVLAYVLMGDIDNEQIGVSPSLRHLQFIQTLTNIILVAIQNKGLVIKGVVQERMKKELEMAAKIQAMLVPSSDNVPDLEQIHIKPFYMSHFEVGGDLYDFGQISKSEVFFCIADVSGKGMSAAMIMSNFQANLRAQLRTKNISLTHVVENLNKNVSKVSKGEHFVTMFLAKYNIYTQRLIYVNAGHLPPLLFDYKSESLNYLTYGCPGLGMLDEIPEIRVGKIRIKNNSKLICFTDGLSEYSIEGKEDYGLTIAKQAMQQKNLNIDQTIEHIINVLDINKENTNIWDDITMLGVQFISIDSTILNKIKK
ncbi:MAG: SpoIIE family protein phosphatase [Bacteroidales bacterium]|nr:SpoIIE family protein phosphatase [Bacteroidales bacterium]